jgi:hypothetical protein
MSRFATLLALLLAGLPGAVAAQGAALRAIEAEGTQFRATLSDGRVLRSPDLVGAKLVVETGGRTLKIRIDEFEAGWSPDGAVCVRHVRVKENTSLAALEEKYPQLKGRTGNICTEVFARAHGAILFNRSSP